MRNPSPAVRGLLASFALSTLSLPLTAQCDPVAQPGPAAPGPLGTVLALATAPNGDWIAGGDFTVADRALANHVARYDGAAWRALGAGVDDTVRAVAIGAGGDVFVAGDFTTAGGIVANRVARWDGATWSPLGQGLDARVEALLVLPNGDLVAGGLFTTAGGAAASRVARWDGTAWSPLGAGANGPIYALEVLPNGDVLAGGQFTQAGGQPAVSLARWNGAAWTAVPGLTHPSYVFDLQALGAGPFAVAGLLRFGGPFAFDSVGLWNGAQVASLGLGGLYNELGVLPNGQLVAGGYTVNGTTGTVSVYNGTTWTPIGAGAPFRTFAFALAANGDLLAAGQRFDDHPTTGGAVARFDGAAWTDVGAAEPARIDAVVAAPAGDVFVGGAFGAIDGVAADNVARWDGDAFLPLGAGVDGPVRAMGVTDGGTLVVAGAFANAGGGPAIRVARWNGAAWSTVGAGLPDVPDAIAANDAGEVVAVVQGQLWRFDGGTWGTIAAAGAVTAVGSAPGGDFVVAGTFAVPGGVTGCARLSAGALTPLTIPAIAVRTLGRDAFGAVLAASPSFSGQVFRLQGSAFTQLGLLPIPFAFVDVLTSLPGGDVLAIGRALDGTVAFVRYDGVGWSAFGPVVRTQTDLAATAAVARDGDLLLGGGPILAAGSVSAGFVRLTAPCAASIAPVGTGCTGAAGPVSLAADSLPWLGATLRSTATGLTTPSLAVHVIGSQPTLLPLPGGGGCSVYQLPEILEALLPTGGQVATALAIPTDPSLTGLVVRTQVVALELDAQGGIVRLTSSNALEATLGRL